MQSLKPTSVCNMTKDQVCRLTMSRRLPCIDKPLSRGTRLHNTSSVMTTLLVKVYLRTIKRRQLGTVKPQNKEIPMHNTTLARFTMLVKV